MTRPKKNLWVGGVLLLFLLIGGAAALGGTAYAYRDKFYPGIRIANLDLQGKDQVDGKALVGQLAQQYASHTTVLTVPDLEKPIENEPDTFADKQLEPTTAQSLGLTFLTDQALDEAWSIGHTKNIKTWLTGVIPALFFGHNQSLVYKTDQAVLDKYINATVVPAAKVPVPAKLVVHENTVSVSEPAPGFEVDQETLIQAIITSFASAMDQDTAYIKVPGKVTYSPVTKNTVTPIATQLDALGEVKIALTGSGFNVRPARAELLTWFAPVQNKKGVVQLVPQKEVVSKYLLSQKRINEDKSLDTVLQKLSGLLTTNPLPASLAIAVAVKPIEVSSNGATLGKFEGKYIEINLTTQRLYTINGDTLVKGYVVSTGKWSTPTPTGIFHINGKIARAWSASFKLWMPYWQNFLNGEYGIHELPEWPNGYKEGENHLGTPVSHGCVRLGVGDAQEVYNWTAEGIPVYIHK